MFGFDDPISNTRPATYQPTRFSNGTPIDWNAVINQGFAIGSQAINAYSGQNTGTQIGYNPNQGGVFAIQGNQSGGGYSNPYANMTPQQIAAYQQGSLGSAAGSGIDGILDWVGKNPMIVLGGAAGAYLLFKPPPGRR